MNDFLASMPAAYARAATATDVVQHARIVERRGARLAYAEPCQLGSATALCLVTDDRPGLLALVTDALLVQGLGIRSAQAYCRKRADRQTDAVIFLELQRPTTAAAVEASELAAFLQMLSELIAEDIRASGIPSPGPRSREAPTRVYFELEALKRGEYVLLVEARDSQGLLHAITSALYGQGARITSCQIGTEAGFARDRFDIERGDAAPLTSAELCDIQLAVLAALPQRR